MTFASILPLVRRIHGAAFAWAVSSVLLLGIGASEAKADFVGAYSAANFTVTNYGGGFTTIDGVDLPSANGFVSFPDLLTLILTGTNDGSGYDGYTDVTVPAVASGLFRFDFLFNTTDAVAQYAGYLIGGAYVPLTDDLGNMRDFGSVSVAVQEGELIGFRAGGDNQGGMPAILTVTNFSAPVPEPAPFELLLVATAAFAARLYSRRKRA